jgi:hypothetical protein
MRKQRMIGRALYSALAANTVQLRHEADVGGNSMLVVASGRRGTVSRSRGAAAEEQLRDEEMRELDDFTEACDASSTISLPPRRRVSA